MAPLLFRLDGIIQKKEVVPDEVDQIKVPETTYQYSS